MDLSQNLESREEASQYRTHNPHLPPQVLFVDDDPSIRQSVEQLLRQTYPSLSLLTVNSAEEAFSVLRETQITLLVSDLKLPSADGMQLIRAARRHNPTLRTVLVTAYGNEAILHMAKTLGCETYIEKPFSAPQFLIQLSQNLMSHDAHRVVFSLRNLIQLLKHNERNGSSAMYLLESATEKGLLAIERGIVTQAYLGETQGFEAFENVLRLPAAQIIELPLTYGGKSLLAINWSLLWVASHVRSEEKRFQLLRSPLSCPQAIVEHAALFDDQLANHYQAKKKSSPK